MTLRVMPEPAVAQLVKTLGQDVHQEAAEELDALLQEWSATL